MQRDTPPAVSREKLYEEIWAEPMFTAAARHGVSGSFLARVCERLNVPRPPRGYWAKLAVGKAPRRPPLPEPRPWDDLEWSRDRQQRWVLPALPQAPQTLPRDRPRRRTDRPSQHELVAGVREHFDDLRQSSNDYLRPRKRSLLDVYVSKDTIDRALDTANVLYLALEDRGHRVMFAPPNRPYSRPDVDERVEGGKVRDRYWIWEPDRPTIVFIGSVAIGLTIFELSEEVEVQWTKGGYVRADQLPGHARRGSAYGYDSTYKRDMPTGRLCLRASSPYWRAKWEKQWREAKPGGLAAKIPGIVRELKSEASTIVKLVEEAEHKAKLECQRWAEERREQEVRDAERLRVKNIEASREQLFAIVKAWGVAKRVEGFFEDAERRAADLGEEDRRPLLDRLGRARQLLGGVDATERFRAWKAPEER